MGHFLLRGIHENDLFKFDITGFEGTILFIDVQFYGTFFG